MKFLKIILTVFGILVVMASLVFLYGSFKLKNIDENNLPKIIQADWIDLSRISQISKFRSGSGHDFSSSGETCRSMKHYFNPLRTADDQELIDENGFPPSFGLEGAIPIYSPVDGEIIDISEDGSIGSQVYIRSEKYPDFTIRLFHIYLLDGYKEGVGVSAGEKIGHIGRIQNTDIAVSIGSLWNPKLVSYFQVMPDDLFAKYQTAGVESRDQLIITKEYRDAYPLECDGEWFRVNYDSKGNEHIYINGYKPERREF